MGNMIYRDLRFDANEDNRVPSAQKPSVPRKITSKSGSKCSKILILKKIINKGRMNNSIMDKKMKLLISFPK